MLRKDLFFLEFMHHFCIPVQMVTINASLLQNWTLCCTIQSFTISRVKRFEARFARLLHYFRILSNSEHSSRSRQQEKFRNGAESGPCITALDIALTRKTCGHFSSWRGVNTRVPYFCRKTCTWSNLCIFTVVVIGKTVVLDPFFKAETQECS